MWCRNPTAGAYFIVAHSSASRKCSLKTVRCQRYVTGRKPTWSPYKISPRCFRFGDGYRGWRLLSAAAKSGKSQKQEEKTLEMFPMCQCSEQFCGSDVITAAFSLTRSFMLISTVPSVAKPSKNSPNENRISPSNVVWRLLAKASGEPWMSVYNL